MLCNIQPQSNTYVDRELRIPKVVHAAFDRHERGSQRFGNFGTNVEHVDNDLSDLGVGALLF